MSFSTHYKLYITAIIIAIFIGGCSQIEPRTGTRVTFTVDPGKPLARPQVVQLSRYLIKKSAFVLHADRARIDSVNKTSLVLLLPGKKIEKKRVGSLLEIGGFEFVHLSNVATKKHPDRPWSMSLPKGKQKSYIFTGPNNQSLDSAKDPENLIMADVVTRNYKPVLTGKDLESTAMYQQIQQGWALLIRLDKAGAGKLETFSSANRGEYLAMFSKSKLINAAEIVDPIKGGEVFLTGFTTEDQVNELVTDINGGDLPARLKVKSVEYY